MRLVLYGISGSGPGDAWAVGEAGVIVRWNGHDWRLHPYRAPGHLRDVCSLSATDVWAVGANGLVVHFDGTSWSVIPSGTNASLRAVWSAANGEVWMVGDSNVVLRRDASGVVMPIVSAEPHEWHDIAGTGPRDIWIVGNSGAIARWDGTALRSFASGTTAELNAMWFGTGADGWIVGSPDEAADGSSAEAIALHWNGATLTRTSTSTREPLIGVWGSGPGDVWAVGQNFGRNEAHSRRPVLHWDGNAWVPRATGAAGWYAGIWGDGSGAVWAVGCCEPLLEWHFTEWQALTRASILHAPEPPLPIGDGRIHRRW